MSAEQLPLFLVCEDGHEYSERFARFLGQRFRFERAATWREVDAALAREEPRALLLDLDFRRVPADGLLGESGPPGAPPTPEQRARWSATQGILLVRYLRGRGVALPALLFADLDDAGQVAFLEATLAPLTVVSSRVGMGQIAERLAEVASHHEARSSRYGGR